MKTLYKEGKACTVDDEQLDAMYKTGWSAETESSLPESEEPAEVEPEAVPEVEEAAPAEETEEEETPKKVPRKISRRKSTKTKE